MNLAAVLFTYLCSGVPIQHVLISRDLWFDMHFVATAAVCCCVVFVTVNPISATNAGAKLRLTDSAFNQLTKVAKTKLATLKMSPISVRGQASFWRYRLKVRMSNNLVIGQLSLSSMSQSKAMHVMIGGVSVTAAANLKIYKWSVDATMNVIGVTLEFDVDIKADVNGMPELTARNCHSKVSTITVNFKNSVLQKLFKYVKKYLIPKITTAAEKALCSSVIKAVNLQGNDELKKINMSIMMNPSIEWDFHLAKSPHFSTQYIETFHKGTVRVNGVSVPSPFTPTPFPAFSQTSKMVYAWMSQYVLNQYTYALHQRGLYNVTYTDADLVVLLKPKLNCSNGLACLISSLAGIKIPPLLNPSAEANIVATKQPMVTFTKAGGVSLTIEARVKISLTAGSITQKLVHVGMYNDTPREDKRCNARLDQNG